MTDRTDEILAPYDVILTGSYFIDLVFTGLPEMPQLGKDIFSQNLELVPGGAFYTALALRRLGVRSGWMCDVGEDIFSQMILEACQEEGIDIALFQHYPQPVRRVAAAFSFTHERGFVSYYDPVEESAPARLQDSLQCLRPTVLMLSNLWMGEELESAMAMRKAYGLRIYMDCQDTDCTLKTPGMVEGLRAVDVFGPNAREAMCITGQATPVDALDALADYTPLVVVKCGGQGVIARQGKQFYRIPALQVNVVDTTGAGDSFNAGFVFGWLRDEPLERCLMFGNICGGLAVTAVGNRAIPNRDKLLELAGQYASLI